MIIVVAGLPGSGKSYFAAKLAERMDAAYINSDKVRKSMHALGKYSFSDKIGIYKEMTKLARQALLTHKFVVVDATFYRSEMRRLFIELANDCAVLIRFIMVYADEVLIQHRLSRPRTDSEADFKIYEIVKKEFDEFVFPHLQLESTDNNLDTMLRKAIEYIRNNHG